MDKNLILEKLSHLRSMVGSMILPHEISKKSALISLILEIEKLIKE